MVQSTVRWKLARETSCSLASPWLGSTRSRFAQLLEERLMVGKGKGLYPYLFQVSVFVLKWRCRGFENGKRGQRKRR